MAYKVVFTKEAWPNVSIALMTRVKHGVRPEIPAESNDTLSNLIRECWLQDSELRPKCNSCIPDIGCLSQSVSE